MGATEMEGPLLGIRIVEFAGMGPAPFGAMLLADMGADVVRIERPVAGTPDADALRHDTLNRGKRSVALDLKTDTGRDAARRLVAQADVLVEGFRPGVMERLGLGPDTLLASHPRLVYARMTGWGQTGPLARRAGHDINYLALSGALHAIGTADSGPVVPLNLVGDFGGGGTFLALGIVSAVLAAQRSGHGRVIDASILDGTANLLAITYSRLATGQWQDARQTNTYDGASPYYTTYACADGGWMAVGAIEPQFLAALLEKLEISPADYGDQHDRGKWPAQRALLAARFATRTRDAWAAMLEDSDTCATPVLSLAEAPLHPHHVARGTFLESPAYAPAPAPRFGGEASRTAAPAPAPGQHDAAFLAGDWPAR